MRLVAFNGPGKFESVSYSAGLLGAPRLTDAIAWVDCSVQAVEAMEAADGERCSSRPANSAPTNRSPEPKNPATTHNR
jgi:hypothetical protein